MRKSLMDDLFTPGFGLLYNFQSPEFSLKVVDFKQKIIKYPGFLEYFEVNCCFVVIYNANCFRKELFQ